MRRATLFRVSVGATALLGAQTAISSTTFHGSQSIPIGGGTESAVYSITTDGTNGTLSSGDILSWTVTLSGPGAPNETYSSAGGLLDYFSDPLSESGSNLLFDFGTNGSGNTPGYAIFWDSTHSNWFCFQRNNCWDTSGGGVGVDYNTQAERGLQIIATAVGGGVPEPATWAMMLIGFGGMGYAMRKRRVAALQLA